MTDGSTAYPQWGLQWTYDRYGNRTGQTVTARAAPSNSLTVNPATNRITSTGFSYDNSGNLTNDAQNRYAYTRNDPVNPGEASEEVWGGYGLRWRNSSRAMGESAS